MPRPELGGNQRGCLEPPTLRVCRGKGYRRCRRGERMRGGGGSLSEHLASPGQRNLTGKRFLLPTPATSGSCGKAAL